MELQGKIKVLGETMEYGSNGFLKREVVIETQGDYPQPIAVEFVQDKTSLMDNYKVGDSVKVGFNLRGREWTNPKGEVKYFNSIQGWKVDKLTSDAESLTPEENDNPFV